MVTGRIVEVSGGSARVELGEGVYATCKLAAKEKAADKAPAKTGPDLSAMTAMLQARWKGKATDDESKSESIHSGQIRSFRIVQLEPEKKTIAVELA